MKLINELSLKYALIDDNIYSPGDVRSVGTITKEKTEANRVNDVVEIKKKEIIEMIKGIGDVWILEQIHKFIINMTKEGS